MAKNPFINWTAADVAQHNARVTGKLKLSVDNPPSKVVLVADPKAVVMVENTDVARLNKTERAYYTYLQGVVLVDWIGVQNLTLKLADDCRYTPDFIVVGCGGRIEAHEVKGWFRDDAKVKLKVAARMFPWINFILVTKDGARWVHKPVKP